MRLKQGVSLQGLVPQMILVVMVAEDCMKKRGLECVITSANDSKHSDTSLHHGLRGKYTDGLCRAIDIRTRFPELNGLEMSVVNEMKDRLGPDFDIVLEAVATPNEHVHAEWDPK